MCTVVVRWSEGEPVQVLALRDELVGREFDDPGEWWPGLPGVIGGRDRSAGGTWCAVDVDRGVTALGPNPPPTRGGGRRGQRRRGAGAQPAAEAGGRCRGAEPGRTAAARRPARCGLGLAVG